MLIRLSISQENVRRGTRYKLHINNTVDIMKLKGKLQKLNHIINKLSYISTIEFLGQFRLN